MLVWALYEQSGRTEKVSLREIADAFEKLHLPKSNATRLKNHFRKSRNIRKVEDDSYAPTSVFLEEMKGLLSDAEVVKEDDLSIDSIQLPPFVGEDRKDDLARMVRVYGQLFLLENSMRGLIEKVLQNHLGDDWWGKASNSSMRRKHKKRVANEDSKKWAPARSDFGPLYALDWSDLITLMRKYPDEFKPFLGESNFLHRFEDAGLLRNVVAHNWVLREQNDFDLIRIYYQDWIKQLNKKHTAI